MRPKSNRAFLVPKLCLGTRPNDRRRGFTLLEVVFALALTLLLLGALLGALDLYRRLSTAGREEVEKAQLVRAIFRKIELDIRSCVYQASESSGSGEAGTATAEQETTGTEEITITEVDPASAYSAESVGIVGDTVTLVVHTNRPSRETSTVLATDPQLLPPMSEQKSVAWFLAVPGADGLSGEAANVAATNRTNATGGLARLEGDRLTTAFADANTDLATLAADTRLLAEEVRLLQFRYFDGLTWYDAWDPSVMGGLPNAVEITLGLGSLSGTSPAEFTEQPTPQAESSLDLYRYVVALPLADPYVLQEGAY